MSCTLTGRWSRQEASFPGIGSQTSGSDEGHSVETAGFDTVDAVLAALQERNYIADRGLGMAVHLALRLGRPLLLEGDAGVGKTEMAKVLADLRGVPLIRLQCYEGIDASQALYEWDYPRQLLHLRMVEASAHAGEPVAPDLYTEQFLLERPLLKAIRAGSRGVLLIDEIDRADDEFEAFLLEILADFQVSIPEFGTVAAEEPPVVILTSNRTREIHEALRRRCLYYWIEHPSVDRLRRIIRMRAPEVDAQLTRRVAETVARLRAMDLFKPPAVAESIEWARALDLLGVDDIDLATAQDTLTTIVKEREDVVRVRSALRDVLGA
ncbi:MoxR family ATPase [Blastococcus brunescens]|uniref:MoxR family ATPase n=1 Tax=Blastococcus brunescens TaxID=1564165 RepID=A0ABZ1B122_9ACTN|nr:MoxR family ATPase [Blastococcus sp. BMG 8361]WRL63588.1 MoxR family ATPase [Blastococcus sp. BMG 8361]